jgi:hypothetical protein
MKYKIHFFKKLEHLQNIDTTSCYINDDHIQTQQKLEYSIHIK